jgi:hypothetical protein
LAVLAGLSQCLFGCGDRIRPPSAEKLAAFNNAGPSGPVVDMDEVVQAHLPKGPYRVHVGDVLELRLSALLYPDVPQAQPGAPGRDTHISRVSDDGLIILPDGRQIKAAGETLASIESEIVTTYYPRLVKTRPAVYVQVAQYATARVRIMGAVVNPGLYELRHDQMSLVALLMQAGGIAGEGAAVIKVTRTGGQSIDRPDPTPSQPVGLPWQQSVPGATRSGTIARSVSEASVAYVCFEREGPLETTGWLSMRHRDETVFRQWLDIGSSRQRWAAIARMEAAVAVKGRAEMDLKLSRLARFLATRSRGRNVHLVAYETKDNWSRERRRPVHRVGEC